MKTIVNLTCAGLWILLVVGVPAWWWDWRGVWVRMCWQPLTAIVRDWNTPVRPTGQHGYVKGRTTGWDLVNGRRTVPVSSGRGPDTGYVGRHRARQWAVIDRAA